MVVAGRDVARPRKLIFQYSLCRVVLMVWYGMIVLAIVWWPFSTRSVESF